MHILNLQTTMKQFHSHNQYHFLEKLPISTDDIRIERPSSMTCILQQQARSLITTKTQYTISSETFLKRSACLPMKPKRTILGWRRCMFRLIKTRIIWEARNWWRSRSHRALREIGRVFSISQDIILSSMRCMVEDGLKSSKKFAQEQLMSKVWSKLALQRSKQPWPSHLRTTRHQPTRYRITRRLKSHRKWRRFRLSNTENPNNHPPSQRNREQVAAQRERHHISKTRSKSIVMLLASRSMVRFRKSWDMTRQNLNARSCTKQSQTNTVTCWRRPCIKATTSCHSNRQG